MQWIVQDRDWSQRFVGRPETALHKIRSPSLGERTILYEKLIQFAYMQNDFSFLLYVILSCIYFVLSFTLSWRCFAFFSLEFLFCLFDSILASNILEFAIGFITFRRDNKRLGRILLPASRYVSVKSKCSGVWTSEHFKF